jgi:hypothetical protein
MTVAKQVITNEEDNGLVIYEGNGTTTFFEFGFDLDEDSTVLVFVDGVLDTASYQLQSNGIRFFVAPAVGAQIVLARTTDITQLRDWTPFGPFPAEKTEGACDKLIMLKQEGLWRRNMNLWSVPDPDSVLIVNDKGTDADILLWHHTDDLAGVFACIVDTQIPPDESPADDADSTVYIQFTDAPPVPPDEPTAIIVDSTPRGQVMTEMNFSGLGNAPPIARSHPLGGNIDVRDFTAFFCMRWTDEDPGEIWDSEMFEVFAAKRPATSPEEFYIAWALYNAQSLPTPRTIIQGDTVELGNLLLPGGLADMNDWIVYMFSMKNIHVPDPDRFKAWFVNLTKGTETEVNTDGVHWDSSQAGDFGHAMDTERTLESRMGFLNNRSGDVTGAFGYKGTMAAHCFQFGQALDFSIEANRRLICTETELVDHGVGGVNIFGQQAAYYSQGDPQLNTGWINTGNPSVFNQAIFASEAEGPPYNYPVQTHPMGDWEYDNMATADASGDAWQEGDTIFIDEGNQVMIYKAALAVVGHSGLRHVRPFFTEETEYSSETVRESQAEGADPAGFGWVDQGTGTLGVDYVYDVVGGRGRAKKLTQAGFARLDSPWLTTGDDVNFCIVDRVTATNKNTGPNMYIITATKDSFTQVFCSASSTLPITPPVDTWGLMDLAVVENTTQPHETETRLWIYIKDDRVAIWSDIGPLLCLETPATAGAGSTIVGFAAGGAGQALLAEIQFGRIVAGNLVP